MRLDEGRLTTGQAPFAYPEAGCRVAGLQGPLVEAGLLDPGSTTVYDRYGMLYLAAWVVALAGLVVRVRSQGVQLTPGLRRAWVVVLRCLALVAVGILGDYAIPVRPRLRFALAALVVAARRDGSRVSSGNT